MTQRLVLTLFEESEKGYSVSLDIRTEKVGGQPSHGDRQIVGLLPRIPSALQDALQSWQSPYRRLSGGRDYRGLIAKSATRFSWPEQAQGLVRELNQWLNSGFSGWQKVRDCIIQTLNPDEENQFFVLTAK